MKVIKKILQVLIVFVLLQIAVITAKSYALVSGYTVEENYIKDIEANTTYNYFVNNFYSDETITIEENGSNVSGTDLIKTGQVLKEGDKYYTLVVTGDTTGDGKADIRDIMQINKHRSSITELTDAYLKAGDVTYDGIVNIRDILKINKYRINLISRLGREVKQIVKAPTNVKVSTGGNVTWTASSNATRYEISIDNENWTEATSGVDYLSTITATEGNRTVYVRAINSDTSKYVSPSSIATKEVIVNNVTIESSNTERGTVSQSSCNVISGTRCVINGDTLTLNGVTIGTKQKDIATIKATANNGYNFLNWTSNSKTINENIQIIAIFKEITDVDPITIKSEELKNLTSTSRFLGTSITRDKIKNISFATSIQGHTVDEQTCFDVSSIKNSGQVLLWVEKIDKEGYVDIVIGQNGGVIANADSSYLFQYIGNSISAEIDVSNLDTSNVTNMSYMFSKLTNVTTIYASYSFITSAVTESIDMFNDSNKITGGQGTRWNTNYIDKTRARIDGGTSSPGYFTKKGAKRNISNATIDSIVSETYNGSAKTPSVTVKWSDGTTLKKNTDYTLSYTNNKNAGTATVTVTGTGNYTGTKKGTFTINKATPTLSISAKSGTIIKGNTAKFTITYNGDGYLSVSSSSTAKAKVSLSSKTVTVTGVASGSATITVSAKAGTNYKAATSVTYKATVQAAIYEVSSVASGKLKYQRSLKNAIDAAKSGATIKILQSCSESDSITISKNLTIDTNGKTMKKSSGTITISSGTTVIKGSGYINYSAIIDAIRVKNSAILKTEGTPRIKSNGNVIVAYNSSTVNLNGGYIWTTGGNWVDKGIASIQMKSSSKLIITNTNVFNEMQAESAIKFASGSTGTCTIGGTSKIGNSAVASGSDTYGSCISYSSTGKLTVKDNAKICAGPYSPLGISLGAKCTVEFLGSSSIYTNDAHYPSCCCIYISVSGCTITFNSNGYFYTRNGNYVARAGNSSNKIKATFNVKKGHFACCEHNDKPGNGKAMFYQNGACNTKYVSTLSLPTEVKVKRMTDYKTVVSDPAYSHWIYNKSE